MSVVKIKQLAGPVDATKGASIVFDNGVPRWSSTVTSALLLPAGDTASRPSTSANGMLRYNSTTDKLETYENGSWVDVRSATFASLTDGPGVLQANKLVATNSSGTALEYIDKPVVKPTLTKYSFRLNFNGNSDGSPSSYQDVPNGWAIALNTSTVVVTHNKGARPVFVFSHGKTTTASATTWGMVDAETFNFRVPTQSTFHTAYDLNTVRFNSVTNSFFATATTGYGIVDIWFLE